MSVFYDLVRFATATTGTGTLAIGATVTGFLSPAQAGATDNVQVTFGIINGNDRELSKGTLNVTNGTLTRDTVVKSTQSNGKVNLSGTSIVYFTMSATDLSGVAPPITKGTGSTSVGAASSVSSIAMSSVFDDTGAAWSSTVNSDRFTVPSGKSRARVTARFSSSAVPFSGSIYRNGSAIASVSSQITTGASGSSLVVVSDWTVVSPGDYITVGAYNGYNGTNNISASMQVEWDGQGVASGAGSNASTSVVLYRIATFFTYSPLASEILLMHAVTDAFSFQAGLSGMAAKVGTNPAAAYAINVLKNGTSIGAINISTAGAVSSTVPATSFAAGDLLTLQAPATADASIQNVAISLRGY